MRRNQSGVVLVGGRCRLRIRGKQRDLDIGERGLGKEREGFLIVCVLLKRKRGN